MNWQMEWSFLRRPRRGRHRRLERLFRAFTRRRPSRHTEPKRSDAPKSRECRWSYRKGSRFCLGASSRTIEPAA
eukprot:1590653-Pyramimonas_sp.AAC.1